LNDKRSQAGEGLDGNIDEIHHTIAP
jgi:hypothetical protein